MATKRKKFYLADIEHIERIATFTMNQGHQDFLNDLTINHPVFAAMAIKYGYRDAKERLAELVEQQKRFNDISSETTECPF